MCVNTEPRASLAAGGGGGACSPPERAVPSAAEEPAEPTIPTHRLWARPWRRHVHAVPTSPEQSLAGREQGGADAPTGELPTAL